MRAVLYSCSLVKRLKVEMFGDNEGATAIAENPSNASRRKHVDVKIHFIRGLIRAEKVSVVHVGSEEKHANIFTKLLRRKTFLVHRAVIMNLS